MGHLAIVSRKSKTGEAAFWPRVWLGVWLGMWLAVWLGLWLGMVTTAT